MRASDVIVYLAAKSGAVGAAAASASSEPVHDVNWVPTWFASATEAVLKDFTKTHKLWWVTAAPGDTLYVPAGFVVTHSIMNRENCMGIKVGCISNPDVASLELILDGHKRAGRSNKALEQALKAVGRMMSLT